MGCRWGLWVVAQQFHVTVYCQFNLGVYAFRIDGEPLLRISGRSPMVFRRLKNIENCRREEGRRQGKTQNKNMGNVSTVQF